MVERVRTSTATSSFGTTRRESHNSELFYARFGAPAISDDDTIAGPFPLTDSCICGDARSMTQLPDNSVALVVTSPPYFAGKQYEAELGIDGVPGSYLEYLDMLRDVFRECVRVLEPGGRIAVNVANLGRRPFRSLAGDVTSILQDDLGLLLRGEVIWRKGDGASGSCAWGSFRSPANPVLRDTSERVVIASKGRFDRALTPKQRADRSLPHVATTGTDEFMSATLDVWTIPPESAKRVGHPAPFPLELPERLIHMYTYEDDLVLDPFLGSGATLVAAARTRRRGVGYDTDPEYVELARRRVVIEGGHAPGIEREGFGARLDRELLEAGWTITGRNRRIKGTGLVVPIEAHDPRGRRWLVDVVGSFAIADPGLRRTESVLAAIGRATVLSGAGHSIVIATSQATTRGSDGARALGLAMPQPISAVVAVGASDAVERWRLLGSTGVG